MRVVKIGPLGLTRYRLALNNDGKTSQQYVPFDIRTRQYSKLICRDKLSLYTKKKNKTVKRVKLNLKI